MGDPRYSSILHKMLGISSNKIQNPNPLTSEQTPFIYGNSGINKALNNKINITPIAPSVFGAMSINKAAAEANEKLKQEALNRKTDLGASGEFGSIPSQNYGEVDFETVPGGLPNYLEQIEKLGGEKTDPQGGLGEVGSSFIENKDGSGVALGGDSKAGLGGAESGAVDLGYGADMNEKLAAQEERNKAIIADESRMQQGQLGQDIEEAPKSKYQENQDSLQALFVANMEEQKQLFGDLADDTGEKSIEDYKAQFQKATGIDVSGEPDNKMALMSLGLSLMQNKAGKGFNLSNILTSVGEAGEASMPAFQKAKDDARAGQVAAGKYALQQTQADEKTKLALAKEKRLALSALSREFRTTAENRFLKKEDHLSQMEQKELTETIKLRAAMIKAGQNSKELSGKNLNIKPIDGQTQLSYNKGIKKVADGKSITVFTTFAEDIRKFKNADFNISRARAKLDNLKDITGNFLKDGTIPILKRATDVAKNWAVAFGVKPETLFATNKLITLDKNGEAIYETKAVSDTELAESIRQTLILEYKKFLTQETGNGISNQDVNRLAEAFGKIDFLGNPAAAISKLEEIDGIFQKTQDQINNVFTAFKDKDNYMTTGQYEKAMGILGEDKGSPQVYKFGKSGQSFDVRMGQNGRMIYSLQKK